MIANVLAAGGAVVCALVHFMSFVGVGPLLSGRLFAVAVLAVFPLGGFAILLLLRVGRTYRVWGSHQLDFVIRRAPKWLRYLVQAAFIYGLIQFLVLVFRGSSHADASLASSAFVAWFYLVFVAVFTVGLGDPRLVEGSTLSVEQKPSLETKS
jgi:hypothetical protein